MTKNKSLPNRIFIDTSAWIELMLKGEQHHEVITAYFKQAIQRGDKMITSDYVLDESWTRLITTQGFHAAKSLREKTHLAAQQHQLLVLWTDEVVYDQAWEIFTKYSDHPLSFTDATIVVHMRILKLTEVLTLDEGFKKAGLVVKPQMNFFD